ncbi:hypothetical protein D5F53_26125 [Paenibacillus lautus]|uniref:Uncharacterized protein n=1 Tax=Paenibacillus lautus TaxID=1401 RepID=A0A385TSL9_PAELA|nr:hypothetical protein D5F53_26125 [Paenibacillus lautus]
MSLPNMMSAAVLDRPLSIGVKQVPVIKKHRSNTCRSGAIFMLPVSPGAHCSSSCRCEDHRRRSRATKFR